MSKPLNAITHKPIKKFSDLVPADVNRVRHPLKSFKAALKHKIKQELPIAGLFLKNSFDVTKMKKKKIVLNPAGDTVEIEPDKKEVVKEVHVLSYQERRKRAINIRKRMPKLKRARELAIRRLAGSKKITKRSRLLSRSYIKRRVAGKMGSNYRNLPTSTKIVIDKMVGKREFAVGAIAKRLLPKVKRAEFNRVSSGKRTSTYNIRPITASYEVVNMISNTFDRIVEYKQPVNETRKVPAIVKVMRALETIKNRKTPLPPVVRPKQNPENPK